MKERTRTEREREDKQTSRDRRGYVIGVITSAAAPRGGGAGNEISCFAPFFIERLQLNRMLNTHFFLSFSQLGKTTNMYCVSIQLM